MLSLMGLLSGWDKKPFSESGISSFINKHGWYYLTVSGGTIDTASINLGITRGAFDKLSQIR